MTQLSRKTLSIVFTLVGIKSSSQSSSWLTHLPECFSGFVLILLSISFSSHVLNGSGTYTDYIEIIRVSVSISILVIILFRRKEWDHLYMNLAEEFDQNIFTPTSREDLQSCKILMRILVMLVLINLIPIFSLHTSKSCSSFFCPMRIEKREFENVICVSGSLLLGLIVDGITIYSVIFFAYIFTGIDCVYDKLYERCSELIKLNQVNIESKTNQGESRRSSILQKIRIEYRKISQVKRKFEKSLGIVLFVWLMGYFCQSYLCLLRASFTSSPVWRKFILNYGTFSITTILLVFIALVADRSIRKSSRLSQISIELLLNHRSNVSSLNLSLDEILFREEIFRISHVPITVIGLAELRLSTLPIFFSMVIEMVVMCHQELYRLPGIIEN